MGKPHHKLDVWNRSISFVTRIYKMTPIFRLKKNSVWFHK